MTKDDIIRMARLGWQYVECPACGSEGARAFPKPEQWTPEDMAYRPGGLAQSEQERDIANLIAGTLCVSRGTAYEMMREALEEAQPEQPTIEQSLIVEEEPVAIADGTFNHNCPIGSLLYTSPPQRQPLTDKQIEAVYENASGQELRPQDYRIVLQFARAIEAAHNIGEKT